jgi:hypothetical protein
MEKYEYMEKIFFLNQLKEIAAGLAMNGHSSEAVSVAEQFPGNVERSFVYVRIAEKLYNKNADPQAFIFADSSLRKFELGRAMIVYVGLEPRPAIVKMLSTIGSRQVNYLANNILRDIPDDRKISGVLSMISGVAKEGNYYRARVAIPALLTESQDLQCRTMILMEICRAEEARSKNNRWHLMDEFLTHSSEYVNFIAN